MKRTEGINHRYRGLDIWPDGDVLEALWEGQRRAVDCLRPALPAIAAAARAIAERLGRQGRLIFVGRGLGRAARRHRGHGARPHLRLSRRADHLAAGRRRDLVARRPWRRGGRRRRWPSGAWQRWRREPARCRDRRRRQRLDRLHAGGGAGGAPGPARSPSASPTIPIRLCSTRAITRSCWTAGPRSSTARPAWAPARRRRRRSIC